MFQRKTSLACLSVAVLALLFVFASAAGAAQTVYVDGIDAAFPPFSFIDESGQPAGFDVEVMQWIAETLDFELQIVPVDWDAIIPTLLSGNIDLIASGMSITAQRSERVNFTQAYWVVDLAIVTRQVDGADGESVPEFNPFTLMQASNRMGVQRGTSSQSWLEDNVIDAGIAIDLVLYDDFLLALEDLDIGRIDGVVLDSPTAESAIAGRDLTIVGTIATGEVYGYAVRPDDSTLLDLLNQGLSLIQASPVWDELVSKWLIGN